uniref:Transcription initiation factor TFIID component TAF4 C-terminal domain-containing protein n=1 Tax=Meloidogyne hapla TaxID=6305 RepID=A0A1I8BNS9_MELHA
MRSVVSFINSRLLSFYPSCSFLKRHCHSEQIKQAVVDQSDISILDAGSFKRLERLSALKMNSEDVKNLQDDISLSQKILHVNTENVEPLYNIVADYITCPLRDDIISENESKDQRMSNLENPPATTIYYLNQPRIIQPEKQQQIQSNNNVFIVHQQQHQNIQNNLYNQNLPPFLSVSMPSTTTIIRSSRSSTQSPQIVSSSASRSSASPALMSSSVDAISAPTEQDVLLGEQSPEEFTVKLREVTKSQDKGNLLPFLRRSLPSLRRSIQNGQHLDLRQALDIDESCSSSQLPQQSDEFALSQSQNHQNFQLSAKSPKMENYSPATSAANIATQSMPKSVENIQNSLDNYRFVRSNETKYEVSTFKKEELNVIAEKGNVGMDPATSSQIDNNTDNVNNLPKMLLNPQALADRILMRMPNADGVDGEVLAVISNAAEARLCTILAHLATLAEHRLEPLRANPLYTSIDEPRKQIRFMEDIDKRAHNHRQTAEKEALLKITKSKGKDKDALEKAKQIQKADREAMVNREANAAAFAALGGSRIGSKRPFAPTIGGTVDWKSGMQNQGLTSGLTGAAKIARLKRVTMRDLQFFLGIDPAIPSNSRLRHRIALYSLCADENTLI